MDLPVYLGASFSSFEQLKQKIQEYQDSNFITLYLRDSKSLNKPRSYNSSRFQNVNSQLKYFYLLYRCKKGGRKFISRSMGIRKKRSEREDDCPMYIKISMNDCGYLQVTALNERHNHEIKKDEYLLNPKKRRLSEEEQKEVKQLIKSGIKSSLIRKYVKQKTGKTIFTQDISNLVIKEKKKNKFNKEDISFEFEDIMQSNDIVTDIIDTALSLQEVPIKAETEICIDINSSEDLSVSGSDAPGAVDSVTIENFNDHKLPSTPTNKAAAYCAYLASELENLPAEQCDEIIEHVTLKLFEVKRRNRK